MRSREASVGRYNGMPVVNWDPQGPLRAIVDHKNYGNYPVTSISFVPQAYNDRAESVGLYIPLENRVVSILYLPYQQQREVFAANTEAVAQQLRALHMRGEQEDLRAHEREHQGHTQLYGTMAQNLEHLVQRVRASQYRTAQVNPLPYLRSDILRLLG